MANKKVSQLVSKPSVLVTDLFPIADPTTGQLFKTTISALGTAIGSGVSSVNTLVGAVVLDTDDIQELASPTNRWFTDTRARAAISGGTGISYNSGTGVITNAVTSGQIATALGYTPANGANYLLLAGGTMGGAITGTIATFASSTSVTALGITLSGATGDGVKITHSAGRAFNIQSSGSGFGILINNETASTSAPFTIQKQGASVITLTDAGAGTFNSSLTASSFIRTSGTSAQFLKADGSVDSSTYLTTGTAASTYVALTGNQTVAGQKTFSSSLFGTSGVFSSVLSSTILSINGDNSTNAVSIVHNSNFNTLVVTQSGAGSAIYATGKLTVIGTAYISGQLQFGADSFLTNLTQTITLPSTTGTLALTSQLSAYLPLAGGTLTGALSGTSATFSGNVGIGGSPTQKLEVVGNVLVKNTLTNASFYLAQEADNSSTLYQYNNGTLKNVLSSNGNSYITGGSVGIGTSTPLKILHIAQGGNVNGILWTDDSAGNYRNEINNSYAGGGAASSNLMTFKVSNGTTTGQATVMTLTGAGNVGIGTTAPTNVASSWTTLEVSAKSSGGGGILYLTNFGSSVKSQIYSDDNGGKVGTTTNHPLTFETNSSPKMTITSGGDVLVGKTSSNWVLVGLQTEINGKTLGVTNSSAGDNNLFLRKNGIAGTVAAFYYDSTLVGSIAITSVLTTYNTTSDYRLKEDLKDIKGLEIVNKIKVYDYKWKSEDTRMDGVLAHELAEVLPYAVSGVKDGKDMQSVDYSKIVPVMVQAIKELKAKIETLEKK
jgi:hypothetical protein